MRAIDLNGGTEILTPDSCNQLLTQSCVGRLGVIVGEKVEIFPVNYVLDGDAIVFATNTGRKVIGALDGEVAFEVDHLDPDTSDAWSVVVRGRCRIVEPDDQCPDMGIPQPWTGAKSLLVRVIPDAISGRRVVSSRRKARQTT